MNKSHKCFWQHAAALLILFVSTSLSVSAIEITDFAKDSTYQGAKLSPDGKHIAVALKTGGKRRLAVFRLSDFEVVGGASMPGRLEPGNYFWANEERIVFEVWESQPWDVEPKNYGELFSVKYDGSSGELIYGHRAGERQTGSNIKKREATRGWAEIIHRLPNEPNKILISSTPWSDSGGQIATVHEIDIRNGKLGKVIQRAPVSYSTFLADSEGNLRFVTGVDKENHKRVYSLVDDEWHEVSADFGGAFYPLALSPNNKKLYYIDNFQQDKTGIFSLNLESGKRREIYTDEQVDITGATFNSHGDSVYAVRVDPGYPTYLMFNKASQEAEIYKMLLNTFPGHKVTITSRDQGGRLWVVYANNDISAGTYYLYDAEKNGLTLLFKNQQHLPADILSTSEAIEFASTDGRIIPGYVTYPESQKDKQNLPLVVLVHGGPHGVRDYWSYDSEVQMLAAQGYAVLRVNYRGSGGFGSEYRRAGYRQWGGLVLDDIISGTEYAIAQGRIDPQRVCIMGGSFGGYAAVQSATKAPDLYRCVVGVAGVYDLAMMYDEGDIPDRLFGESYLNRAIGTDPGELKSYSPVHNADKLKAPVLITHGKKDRRVPIEQAEALRKALDDVNADYEWFITSAEAHGYFDEENRAEYFLKVSEFLNKYLGSQSNALAKVQ